MLFLSVIMVVKKRTFVKMRGSLPPQAYAFITGIEIQRRMFGKEKMKALQLLQYLRIGHPAGKGKVKEDSKEYLFNNLLDRCQISYTPGLDTRVLPGFGALLESKKSLKYLLSPT